MKKAAVALSLAGLAAYDASAQEAVQWRTEDGGNGHWYAADPTARDWQAAKVLAESIGGHLATIHSSAENELVLSVALPNYGDFWLGGTRVIDGCRSDCFEWVTGEPWTFFASWNPSDAGVCFQPNPNACGWNGPGTGTVLEISARPDFSPGHWNDESPTLYFYGSIIGAGSIIEWSADCNSDGIVDYGQIRAGAFVDANANNIPDCCESGAPRDCAASGDGSDAANLVINGGFDEGVDGWSFANIDGAGGWRDSGGQPGGRFILNDGGAFATDPTIEQTVSGLIPRGVYRLSGGFKGESIANSPTGGVSFAVDVDGTTSFTAAAADLTTWRSFSFDFEAASTEVAVRLRAEIGGTDNDFAIDNVALVLVSPPTCQGDVSRNGAVNAIDLAAVLGAWGTDGRGKFDCDANRDGIVDALDLAQVLSDWGPCP